MIFSAIHIVEQTLNDYLKLKFKSNDNRLEVCNLLDQDGRLALTDPNKVIATLINIERESSMGIAPKINNHHNGRHTLGNPPLHINLYLLFTSLYSGKNYKEGLKFLSAIMEYLQAHACFNHHNTPQLSKRIEKLTFENVNLDIQNLSHLWGTIGGKYMPSALYKMRMVTIDQEAVEAEIQSVEAPNTKAVV